MFNFFSVGGGTGSGTNVKIMESIYDKYKKNTNFLNVMNIPKSPKWSQVVEPINASLAISKLQSLSDINLIFNNTSNFNVFLIFNLSGFFLTTTLF